MPETMYDGPDVDEEDEEEELEEVDPSDNDGARFEKAIDELYGKPGESR